MTLTSELVALILVSPVLWCRSVERALRKALERFRQVEPEAAVLGEPLKELATAATAYIVVEARFASATEL